jgi:hypothetical protein
MDFKLVPKTAGERIVREGTYSEELKTAVAEAWLYAQEHGEHSDLIADEFKTKEERDDWLRKAQAYGKTQGLYLSKARGYETADTVLRFTVVNLAEREAKIRERKERAAKIEALKAAGVEISRGKGGVDVDAEFAKLAK